MFDRKFNKFNATMYQRWHFRRVHHDFFTTFLLSVRYLFQSFRCVYHGNCQRQRFEILICREQLQLIASVSNHKKFLRKTIDLKI